MYNNNDPHGWEIRTREGVLIEKGFSNYAKAAAQIRAFSQDLARAKEWEAARLARRGLFFPVRSR